MICVLNAALIPGIKTSISCIIIKEYVFLQIVGLEVEHRAVNLRQKENHQTEFGYLHQKFLFWMYFGLAKQEVPYKRKLKFLNTVIRKLLLFPRSYLRSTAKMLKKIGINKLLYPNWSQVEVLSIQYCRPFYYYCRILFQ